jgi:hypothetical protein
VPEVMKMLIAAASPCADVAQHFSPTQSTVASTRPASTSHAEALRLEDAGNVRPLQHHRRSGSR